MHILIDSDWSKMYDFVRKNLYSFISIAYFDVSEHSVSSNKVYLVAGKGLTPPHR